MSRFKELVTQLDECLDTITLSELAKNKDNLQEDLLTIKNKIDEFFMMISPRNRRMKLEMGVK
jgi:hypothetical protein